MCFPFIQSKSKPDKTIEQIIIEKSAGMTDAQKAQYWYDLEKILISCLGKIDNLPILTISSAEWEAVALTQYPSLQDIKLPDVTFQTTTLEGMKKILTLDWTDLVPYVSQISDCDEYADRLHTHLFDYYHITGVLETWGNTDKGRHGFNLAVLQDGGKWAARLIEPQTDEIFLDNGPLGKYVPDSVVNKKAVLK